MNNQEPDRISRLTVRPMRENNGEGNGWDDCSDAEAVQFAVDNGDAIASIVEIFDTRAEADAYIARSGR